MITAALLAAVVLVESGGNPKAASGKGAVGIFQLTPIGVKEVSNQYGVSSGIDREDILLSAWYGARLLRHYGERSKNQREMLALWNGGYRQLWRMRAGQPLAFETEAFIARVLDTRGRVMREGCGAFLDSELCAVLKYESRPGGPGMRVSHINYEALPKRGGYYAGKF